ncbi:hypothetical protein DCS_00115 [Drechmeria coniospora]|uniref:Uncharacterized protein n=1 Tax=Drechmeria coniospora TaxID=98403 RepID=A0A151GPI9_DRECN|nr:hypothetical protein DCS_00115 [Drechmeria coniospora]KYK58988.1 hypothetical protein DCS_00115 [Drechmeria coniospora]
MKRYADDTPALLERSWRVASGKERQEINEASRQTGGTDGGTDGGGETSSAGALEYRNRSVE